MPCLSRPKSFRTYVRGGGEQKNRRVKSKLPTLGITDMKIIKLKRLTLVILLLICWADAYADEVYLKNGDRITGEIIKENKKEISVKTKAFGVISIRRDSLERIVKAGVEKLPEESREVKEVIWKREIAAGYNRTTGNTRDSQLSASFFISRNKKHASEITLKGDVYYSSTDRKMNAQKWRGIARYAFNFGSTRKWYNFYRLESDHDRFADIDYRIIPSAGVGYWFYDLPGIKFMAELAAGLDHTNYRSKTKDRDEAILIPRAFFEKELFANLKISQDLYLYPAFEDFSQYRLRSETIFTVALNKKLSLRLSLIDDYNSVPLIDTKKNDLRLISSLAYSF